MLRIDTTNKDIQQNNADVSIIDQQIWEHFKTDLNKKDLENALEETDAALRELSKANILEMRSMSKPNALVDTTMQIVCALKGFKNLNWATAREFLSKPSIKIELKGASVGHNGHMGSLRPENVLRAQ